MSRKKIIIPRRLAKKQEQDEFVKRVLDLFFGPSKLTQAEIARKEGVTRGRICQIVHEAEHKQKVLA